MSVSILPQKSINNLLETGLNNLETPCYIFNSDQLQNNYTRLKTVLGTQLVVSVKANPCPELFLRASHVMQDGYEVASLKELNLVVGKANGKKYVNNPSMGIALLRAAAGARATIILDNLAQIDLLKSILETRPVQPVILRLNNSVLNTFFPKHTPLRPTHFGMDWETLPIAIRSLQASNIKIDGFHFFKGSNNFVTTALDTLEAVKNFIPEAEKLLQHSIHFLNLGGGFSQNWENELFDFSAYRNAIHKLPNHIKIAHESGRGIFSSAGKFIVKVLSTKILNQKLIAICDGGIAQNFLLCRTESPIKQYQQPKLWRNSKTPLRISSLPVMYAGTTCSHDDIISKSPAGSVSPEKGDFCIFDNCGAYNSTYTVTNFLGLNEPSLYIGSLPIEASDTFADPVKLSTNT